MPGFQSGERGSSPRRVANCSLGRSGLYTGLKIPGAPIVTERLHHVARARRASIIKRIHRASGVLFSWSRGVSVKDSNGSDSQEHPNPFTEDGAGCSKPERPGAIPGGGAEPRHNHYHGRYEQDRSNRGFGPLRQHGQRSNRHGRRVQEVNNRSLMRLVSQLDCRSSEAEAVSAGSANRD